MPKTPNLDAAYSLKTPQDSVRLYRDWADTYDTGFAAENDYRLHLHVARAFAGIGGTGPVLDIGAGTGLCGAALRELGVAPVDATDISPEMLDVARGKNIYRELFAGDILAGLDKPADSYAGAVSSGTFTTGHVGPEALDEVLRLVRPGGRVTLSVNALHYRSAGFSDKFDALAAQIGDLALTEVPIYGSAATGPHAKDRALLAAFRVS